MREKNRIAGLFAAFWLIAWFGAALAISGLSAAPSYTLPRTLGGPRFSHPLGFDAFGRDLLNITLRGSVHSATFASIAVLVAFLSAFFLGSLGIIAPRAGREVFVRGLDFFLSFPSLLIALAWAAIHGPSWNTLTVALLVETVPSLCRLTFLRAEEIRKEEYIEAASALGANSTQLLGRHYLPALFSLCVLKLPRLFAFALLAESMLSFLGVGAPIGSDTWGSLLAQGKDYLIEAPHIAIGTGLPLIMTILAVQILFEPF